MTIFILHSEKTNLRGILRKWLLEPKANVFVGNLTKPLHENLWEMIQAECSDGAICIYSTNNEQGLDIIAFGDNAYAVKDIDGVKLVSTIL